MPPKRSLHTYPPRPLSPAPCTEPTGSPTITPSAASSVLTSPTSSPSPTPSPPPPPRRNLHRTPSLVGGLRPSPRRGPSTLRFAATVPSPIEKHRLPRPTGAGRMNLEKLVDWDKSILDAIKVCSSLFSLHPILTCKSEGSKDAHIDPTSAQLVLCKTRP